MKFKSSLVALLSSALAAGGYAQIAYATRVDTVGSPGDTELYAVDVTTGATTFIGLTGMDLLEGLSVSPTGELFGTDGFGDLYRISTTTGVGSLVGPSSLGPAPEGLDHRGNDLFATDFEGMPSLYKLDESDGSATLIATADSPTGLVRAMAFSPDQSLAYLVGDTAGTESLFTMAMDGTITSVGPLLNNSHLWAADFDEATGTLWGIDGAGAIGKINLSTGFFSITSSTGLDNWTDMTIAAPVPEPFTLMMGAGALIAAARRRRKVLSIESP